MAHYDCRNCGKSASYYPNCCKTQQGDYIKRQKEKWARDKAAEMLKAQHDEEIMNLALNLFDGKYYEEDETYLKYYLKEIKPIEKED
jgi:hypothetical protein